MNSKTVVVIFAALVAAAWADSRLDIVLSARDLPNFDVCCSPGVYPPDSYAVVYYSPNNFDPYVEQGRTAILSDNNNPDWSDIFNFVATTNSAQRLKIEVYDSDVDADDYIGYIEFSFNDILNAFGNQLERDLSPSGNGYMRVVGRVNGTATAAVDDLFNRPGHKFHTYALPVQHATIKKITA